VEEVTPNSTVRAAAGGAARERQSGQRRVRRGTRSLAVRGLAATVAAAALVAPAAAAAGPSLIAQAKAAVQRQNALDEARHIIPFKRGTKFTITCAIKGDNVLCKEHAGPEQCINGRPWILLSDEFVIVGHQIRGGTLGLVLTYNYCH
jgi:hypothetical protein